MPARPAEPGGAFGAGTAQKARAWRKGRWGTNIRGEQEKREELRKYIFLWRFIFSKKQDILNVWILSLSSIPPLLITK